MIHPASVNFENAKIAVLAGGGIKGLAFGPVFRLFEDAGIYNNFENLIGSSVGGITASMIALGANAEELETFLATGGEGLMDIFSTPTLFATGGLKALSSLMDKGGAAKGYILYHTSQATVAKNLGSPHATFADLEKKIGQKSKSGGKFRNLELTVTVEDPRGSYQIVCSPKTTPNMPIALAMRMTAGLPIAFPNVRLTSEEIIEYTKGATEPLVKYTRITPIQRKFFKVDFPKFPPFEAEYFYSRTCLEKQEIIDTIRNDLLNNSVQNGVLMCSDGSVVDNLPIYLAVNRPEEERGLDNTIALDFEEPWRHKRRIENCYLYAKGKIITPEDEKYYVDAILNPSWNDMVYYHFKNTIHDSRIPPSHQLAILQKENMLSFDVDDISAADFELETVSASGSKKGDPTPKTHDEKVTYLLKNGYKAGVHYLTSKGYIPKKSFFEMYPAEMTKAKQRDNVELQSFQTQIDIDEKALAAWENVLSLLMQATHGEYHDIEVLLYENIVEMREAIQNAKTLNQNREESDRAVGLINKATCFTEQHIDIILHAKIKCDKLFSKIVDQLNLIDKIHFNNLDKTKRVIDELRKTDPVLAENYDKLIKLKESSKLFEEMLSLVRDESVIAGIRRGKATEPKYLERIVMFTKMKTGYSNL